MKTRSDVSDLIYSHDIMIRSGMIYQSCSGIYSWTFLGLKILRKIESIIRYFHNYDGCNEVLISTLQPAFLWEKSERIGDYGMELLKISDRHDAKFVYGPTAEEAVTDLFHQYCCSYKNCPSILYNIQWKFRDEIRPRHGVMRAREFLMSDAYSFDVDEEAAMISYQKMFNIFTNIFNKIGLPYVVVKADSGPIGGDCSHEFHLLSINGESEIVFDKSYEERVLKCEKMSLSDVENGKFFSFEKLNGECFPDMVKYSSIEVGHNFYFADKYTLSMKYFLQPASGARFHAKMGSYGIGISRLVAAIIEASHDDCGVRWPLCVAPFEIIIINFHQRNEDTAKYANDIYRIFVHHGIDVGIDDRNLSGSERMLDANLIGCGYMICINENDYKNGMVKVISRNSSDSFNDMIHVSDVVETLLKNIISQRQNSLAIMS